MVNHSIIKTVKRAAGLEKRRGHNANGNKLPGSLVITKEAHIMKTGLRIRTVTGEEYEVHGTVTARDFYDYGIVYYCDGRSFPAEIVLEVMKG